MGSSAETPMVDERNHDDALRAKVGAELIEVVR
jgi:hypothetical protein